MIAVHEASDEARRLLFGDSRFREAHPTLALEMEGLGDNAHGQHAAREGHED